MQKKTDFFELRLALGSELLHWTPVHSNWTPIHYKWIPFFPNGPRPISLDPRSVATWIRNPQGLTPSWGFLITGGGVYLAYTHKFQIREPTTYYLSSESLFASRAHMFRKTTTRQPRGPLDLIVKIQYTSAKTRILSKSNLAPKRLQNAPPEG